MESLLSLIPEWVYWLVGMAGIVTGLFLKWKWVVPVLQFLQKKLMPAKRFDVSHEALEGANDEFKALQSSDMEFRETVMVHFYTVDILTNDSPLTIKRLWVRSVTGDTFKPWRFGDMFLVPDEKVRIESQAIKSFYIRAPYAQEPAPLASIHIEYNDKVKVIQILSRWTRLRLAVGLK